MTSSHFFHHFTPAENVVILREALRISRKGVAVTDTRRHYAPLLFVGALVALRLFGRITRSDAPGSIRRGYTVAEAQAITSEVAAAKVVKFFPFRFAIVLVK